MPETKEKVETTEEEEQTEEQTEEETEATDEVKSYLKAIGKEIKSELQDEVKKFLEEQKEAQEAKAGLYHPEVKEERKDLNQYVRKFMSAVVGNDTATLKELSTDDTGSPFGGYVVDSELSAEIRHLITQYGVARREFTNVQMSKNEWRANNLATDISSYWVDEGGVVNSSEVVLGQEDLTLKKLGVIVTMTNELLQDEEIDLMQFVGTRVAEEFARREDDAFFNGDGTSSYGGFTGLLNLNGVNTVNLGGSTTSGSTSFSDLTADDLINMQDESPQIVARQGKYYMNRTIMSIVRKLKDSNGFPIFQALSEGGPGTIWGRPVVEVEVMPSTSDDAVSTPFVIYGDLSRAAVFGFRGGLAMTQSNSAVVRNVADDADINTFTTDREAVRWTERVGYVSLIPNAVTIAQTAAS